MDSIKDHLNSKMRFKTSLGVIKIDAIAENNLIASFENGKSEFLVSQDELLATAILLKCEGSCNGFLDGNSSSHCLNCGSVSKFIKGKWVVITTPFEEYKK